MLCIERFGKVLIVTLILSHTYNTLRLTFLDLHFKVLTNEKRDGLKEVSIEKSRFAIHAILKKICEDPVL